jgi:hypothetical protein
MVALNAPAKLASMATGSLVAMLTSVASILVHVMLTLSATTLKAHSSVAAILDSPEMESRADVRRPRVVMC